MYASLSEEGYCLSAGRARGAEMLREGRLSRDAGRAGILAGVMQRYVRGVMTLVCAA